MPESSARSISAFGDPEGAPMPLACRGCGRVNPDAARYCYHDGTPFTGHVAGVGTLPVGTQPFPAAFVFPSGRTCRNFDELVLACEANWTEAQGVLRRGYLESFLG